MKKCQSCHSENKDKNIYCINCGEKIISPVPQGTQKINVPADKTGKGLSGFKIFLIILFSFLGILIITFTCIFIFTDIFSNQAIAEEPLEDIPEAELSQDQIRLISMFGYPDEFVIMLDQDGEVKRVETWIYEDMEAYFIFQDGIYVEGDRLVTPKLEGDRLGVKPENFNFGMKSGHIEKLLGFSGDELIDPETGYSVFSYYNGELVCSFNDMGELIAVTRARRTGDNNED